MDTPVRPARMFTSSPPAIGTFFKSGSAAFAEALGTTPLDFLLVDRQHASPDMETVENVIRAADLYDLPVITRVAGTSADPINNLLDLGVSGLMLPQIESSATIQDIASRVRYSQGRSFAMSTRAGRFGNADRKEYLQFVEEEIALIPQIESEEGLKALDAIAAEPATTALMIGPADLSMSLGVSIGSDKYEEALDRVYSIATECGIGVGIYVNTVSELERYVERGSSFVVFGSDIGLTTTRLNNILPIDQVGESKGRTD